MTRIGFLGPGAMGGATARNGIAAGFEVARALGAGEEGSSAVFRAAGG